MSLRFRQSFQVFPGVRINVGRTGVSASIGVPGATVNVGAAGIRATLGVPGAGLSYSTRLGTAGSGGTSGWPGAADTKVYQPKIDDSVPRAAPSVSAPYIPTFGMREISSRSVETLTSENLVEFRDMIVSARNQRAIVEEDLSTAIAELNALSAEVARRRSSLLRWFYRKRIEAIDSDLLPVAANEVERLTMWKEATHIEASFETSDVAQRAYAQLVRAFEVLRSSRRIWDVTSDRVANRVMERTAAVRTVDRRPVEINFSSSDLIRFDGRALRFGNINGEDILIYPGLALMPRADGMFALVDLRELRITYAPHNFIEEEPLAEDATVVGHTWVKVNKDGSPDRRFKDNYQIPICVYGKLVFTSSTGVREEYQFSHVAAAEAFSSAFAGYAQSLSSAAHVA